MQKTILILVFGLFHAGSAQAQEAKNIRSDSILLAAREIISSSNYCALITVDSIGEAHARTMEVYPPEKDFTIWFGTNIKSRKVQEIKHNPRLTIYYAGLGDNGYVSILGKGILVNNKSKIAKYWRKEWENYFMDKKDFVLIKVIPEKMEIISYKNNLNGDKETWKAVNYKF